MLTKSITMFCALPSVKMNILSYNITTCVVTIWCYVCFNFIFSEALFVSCPIPTSSVDTINRRTRHDVNKIVNNSRNDTVSANGKVYYVQKFHPIQHSKKAHHFHRSHNEKNNFFKNSISENYTKCTTPNNDTGYCTSLETCAVLNNVADKPTNKEFLKDSICSNFNETIQYCCGKYENFKYLLPKRPLPKECGYDSLYFMKGKILGGTQAKLGEFPWLARIIHTNDDNEKNVGCAGFLIHKRFILTAAHCVKSPRLSLIGNITEIQLGEHNTQTEKDCNGLKCADPLQTMKVKSIIPHPEYRHNSRDHHYDIALIYLKGEAKFSDYVQPICLSNKPKIPPAYFISGWGKTENGTYSNIKMKLSIPPFDITECNQLYKRMHAKVGQSQFCAGGQKDKDSCVGDSGGPLMFSDETKKWFGVGVVSYGVSCGLEGWPGVYTSIPFFYKWIVDEIMRIREPSLWRYYKNSTKF